MGWPKGKKRLPLTPEQKEKRRKAQVGYTGPDHPFCVFCQMSIIPKPGQKVEDAVVNHIDSLAHQSKAWPEPEHGMVREGCRGKLRLKRRA